LECACLPRALTARALSARDSPPRPAQCGAARREDDLYFCTYCQSILPPSTAHDYFSLLGETRRFDLVPQALELAFKEAQKLLHPDKFTTRGEEERRHSAAQAARVNAAYATLRAPLPRARYLVRLPPPAAARAHPPAQLQLQGAPASEEGTMGDAELLAEVMEAREEAEAARGSPAALRELRARVAAQAEETEGALRRAFGAADLEGARRGVDRLSYLEKLGEDLQEEAHAAEARGHAAAEQALHGQASHTLGDDTRG